MRTTRLLCRRGIFFLWEEQKNFCWWQKYDLTFDAKKPVKPEWSFKCLALKLKGFINKNEWIIVFEIRDVLVFAISVH